MKTCSFLFHSNLSKEQVEAGGEASMIFLLQIIHKFFIYLAFIQEFTFPSANLDMNLWTSLSSVTNQITHL